MLGPLLVRKKKDQISIRMEFSVGGNEIKPQ